MADEPDWDGLMRKPLWTIEDLALFLSRTVDGVRTMRKIGHLPPACAPERDDGKRGNRRLYWFRDDIIEWLRGGQEPDDYDPPPPRPR